MYLEVPFRAVVRNVINDLFREMRTRQCPRERRQRETLISISRDLAASVLLSP